jgi:hypothetical protein
MLIPATILSLIFASVGFLITKKNARYMLSGYNTMSEKQRLLVDIDAYLYFFKRFMMIAATGVGILFFKGFQNNDMLIKEDSLEITGMYGERIDRDKILNVELVDKLPVIIMKSDGFAAGDFRKGYFRTKDRKTVKLIMNKKENPLLLLRTTKGEIYFSSANVRSEDLLLQIQKWKHFN